VDVKPMPGLEHLPFAEVWFHEIDDARWRKASAAALAIDKTGLEAWTTDRTPEVASFLEARGYEIVRRYVISQLDVTAVREPEPPAFELTTFAQRPDLAPALFDIARESYPDQPGRPEQRMDSFDEWRSWGLDAHPAETYFIALDGGRPIGYGFLSVEDGTWWHGFAAVARAARGRRVASSIKRAQIRWAKDNGVPTLRTANEERLIGMLAMNARLGYRPLYTELVLRGPVAQVPPAGFEPALPA
jgi:GNAT superfamily N-acetyltransferase